MTPQIRRAPGFTLIEVILAVSLSAILFVLIGAGLNAYTRLVAGRRANVAQAQLARAILHRMAADIRAAYYAEDAAQATEAVEGDTGEDGTANDSSISTTADLTQTAVQVTPGLYGNAYELQIDTWGRFAKPVKYDMMIASGIEPYAANLLSEPKIITFYLRTSDASELVGTPLESLDSELDSDRIVLVRRVQNRAKAVFAAMGGGGLATNDGEQLLSDQVVSLSFAYFDGLTWLEEWDSSLMGGLPSAVQITLSVVEDVAAADVDGTTLTTDNIYQLTVALPTAEIATTDTSTTGI